MISMNQVWDDTVAFIRRESALLIPLALATLYVGDVLGAVARIPKQGEPIGALATLVVILATVWSIIGQLAIIALVLKAGLSVGESLRLGSVRLGKVLLIALLLGVGFTIAVVPFAMILLANGLNVADPAVLTKLPPWAAVVGLGLLGAILWLGIRLSMLNALVVDRNPGVIQAIKVAFGLTRGIVARLAVCFLIYILVATILGSAVRFVFGSLFALVGAAAGSTFVGTVLTALTSGIVSATLSLIATVFLATLYRRVSTGI